MPGSAGLIADEKEALKVAEEIGFPLMIKATAGGRAQEHHTLACQLSPVLPAAHAQARASKLHPEQIGDASWLRWTGL